MEEAEVIRANTFARFPSTNTSRFYKGFNPKHGLRRKGCKGLLYDKM